MPAYVGGKWYSDWNQFGQAVKRFVDDEPKPAPPQPPDMGPGISYLQAMLVNAKAENESLHTEIQRLKDSIAALVLEYNKNLDLYNKYVVDVKKDEDRSNAYCTAMQSASELVAAKARADAQELARMQGLLNQRQRGLNLASFNPRPPPGRPPPRIRAPN